VSEQLCVLMVHAHPDDECLSTGGTLARYSAEGVRTVLVIATGGEEGEIVVPELDTPENHARLSAIRDEELACSVGHLGVSQLERLGYRDSGMVGTESNHHPDCFHQADPEQAIGRVVALVRRHRPHVLVTYDERGGYGHPDHIACHKATVGAFEAAGDPARFPEAGPSWQPLKLYFTALPRERLQAAWGRMKELGMPSPLDNPEFDLAMFTVPEAVVTSAVPVHDYIEQKRRAIACHVTQIRQDGPFLAMPEDLAREAFGTEHYVRAVSHMAAPEREDDLLAGLG
jgi:N-acetyl-1-D-myo-inositol-2-amino-2-deoxy-alpha-D-glucopyranoside deacetylase